MAEAWVREALADGSALGSLELQYQPVVWLASGEVYGAESFVRWRGDDDAILPTADWLPHAVMTGAIVECTRAVLPAWVASSRGAAGPIVALNFSGQQLADREFMDEVLDIAPEVAAGLAVEIHQLQFVVDHANAVDPGGSWVPVDDIDEQIDTLKHHGFAVWLDDFGDGSADEAIIGHADIDVVKLDRRLLDAEPAALIDLVTTIHDQSKLALFECIETDAHERLAVDSGVDLGQGFLYAPSLDVAGFADCVAAGRAPKL
jgi:EAL domain-containing protein (putative c-di-GMP-specific phosphodiesterase class I)